MTLIFALSLCTDLMKSGLSCSSNREAQVEHGMLKAIVMPASAFATAALPAGAAAELAETATAVAAPNAARRATSR